MHIFSHELRLQGAGQGSLPAVVQQVWRQHWDVNVLPIHGVEQSNRSMETGS